MSGPVNILLMMKDRKVIDINLDFGKYDILDESIVPFTLRGKFKPVIDFTEVRSEYDDTKRQSTIRDNNANFTEWLASRVLPMSRENARRICIIFGFDQR